MTRPARRYIAIWIGGLCLLLCQGCATTPYRFSSFQTREDAPPLDVRYGKPHKTLDCMAKVVGFPGRIIPLHPKINRHEISPETLEKLRTYLEENDLTDVSVCINHYDPKGEWRKLRENKRIAPGWRYTVGSLSIIGYTLLPLRVFGGDRYNPFTNSLYVNSDVPAVLLYDAAYAKDVHSRNLPGTYAFVNELPLFSLWHQTKAASDVIGYAQLEEDWELEKEAYHVLYPHIGASSTAVAGPFVPFFVHPLISLGGAAVGHVAGQSVAAQRRKTIERNAPQPPASPPVPEGSTTGEGEIELAVFAKEKQANAMASPDNRPLTRSSNTSKQP